MGKSNSPIFILHTNIVSYNWVKYRTIRICGSRFHIGLMSYNECNGTTWTVDHMSYRTEDHMGIRLRITSATGLRIAYEPQD